MTTIRKCFRALGLMIDGLSITFAGIVAFLSAHMAAYCLWQIRDAWMELAFPTAHWDKYEIVLAWVQGALVTGQGMLILKTWATAGALGFFALVTVLAGHDALLKARSRMG